MFGTNSNRIFTVGYYSKVWLGTKYELKKQEYSLSEKNSTKAAGRPRKTQEDNIHNL